MRLMDSSGRKMKPDREGCALQTIGESTQEKGQKGTSKMAPPKVCEVYKNFRFSYNKGTVENNGHITPFCY